MAYPVTVAVEPRLADRNRLTTAFRAILAIPHVFLVGGAGIGLAYNTDSQTSASAEGGLLGALVVLLAVVSWCTLVFAGTHIAGIRRLTLFYMHWRVRALAYLMLLQDAYPPFGDGPYPATVAVVDPPGPRNRLTVFFRILLGSPHMIALTLVMLAWGLGTVVAWFSILFTGRYPQGLYDFSVGALRWRLRFDAYVLLLVDDYPPFSLR
ncbi:MAG: DUF4389 domain-containing protein [Acidobacteria bacterium]|nr:DUF4389 domain-containing protein [Acidobacteriota bacterium]